MWDKIVKALSAAVGAVLSFFCGMPPLVWVLLAIMSLDYATGLICGFGHGILCVFGVLCRFGLGVPGVFGVLCRFGHSVTRIHCFRRRFLRRLSARSGKKR